MARIWADVTKSVISPVRVSVAAQNMRYLMKKYAETGDSRRITLEIRPGAG